MAIFRKESIEQLKQKVDLPTVLEQWIELKRSGASFKALCPFHDEKTPSFTVQRGDSHYHCFGCGAHGDAIQFLMDYQRLSFSDALEWLADKFQVTLERVESEDKGHPKKLLMDALEKASLFYHTLLLHTNEGEAPLRYFYQREVSPSFISQFQLGWSPQTPGLLRKYLHEQGFDDLILEAAGLIKIDQDGRYRDFFLDRLMFPIRSPQGRVIGFSARKWKEETFGGKYINTPETPLFKKSRTLFALSYSRKRIAKERKAVIVEGQLDALRLIHTGLDLAVAGQGTAFGEGHVQELLSLGINQVFLALDSDSAGQEATVKIGHLFQKEGVEVFVLSLPPGQDPDSFVKTRGIEPFIGLMKKGEQYLGFLVRHLSQKINIQSPAGKNELLTTIANQIRTWSNPVMVHESLKKLAHLLNVPEETAGVGAIPMPSYYVKHSNTAGIEEIDPNEVLETDFIRWLLLAAPSEPTLFTLAKINLEPSSLVTSGVQKIYQTLLTAHSLKQHLDLMTLLIENPEPSVQSILSHLHDKKINRDKALQGLSETIQKILDRNWMKERETIRQKIQSGQLSEEETSHWIKEFDRIKSQAPEVKNM